MLFRSGRFRSPPANPLLPSVSGAVPASRDGGKPRISTVRVDRCSLVGVFVFVADIGLGWVSAAVKNKVSPSLLQSGGVAVGEVVEFCVLVRLLFVSLPLTGRGGEGRRWWWKVLEGFPRSSPRWMTRTAMTMPR